MDATSKTSFKDASFVMPVRNEEQYLASAVESVFAQVAPGKTELILAIAPSIDKTRAIAEELQSRFKSLKIIDNPTGDTASGLNLAIAAASYEVIVRVDAHSQLTENYLTTALEVLSETGAANVGGRMHAVGISPLQQAVAFGYNNRVGLGGGSFHVGGKAGAVETVYLGVFQKSWLQKVGGFDPKWVRGQDWELNQRIRAAGGVVWFDFATLCGTARSQNDYLEISRRFHTVILSDVPKMSAEMASEARRFTWLVDVLYDHRIKLLISAEVEAELLFTEGSFATEFQRTVSRIIEMQSREYKESERRKLASVMSS